MRVLVTGSTGLVGEALVARLREAGHEPVRLVRRTHEGPEASVKWNPAKGEIDAADLEGVDAIVHLAGENVADGRWDDAKKQRIYDSRVRSTKLLVETMRDLNQPPRILVCASAIGYYGARGDEELDEHSEPGDGFLAQVCKDWEHATVPAAEAGIRVVNARIGVVLSKQGGALAKMLTPFKLGVGGVLGDGRQYMSWIALDDLVGVLMHALETESLTGPVNAVTPNPVTNREFTKTLGKAIHRPTPFPVPKFALRLALREMADEMLLASIPQTAGRIRLPVQARRAFRRVPRAPLALAKPLGAMGLPLVISLRRAVYCGSTNRGRLWIMPTFSYVARNRSGQKKQGTVDADDRQSAIQTLSSRGLTPDKVVPKRSGINFGGGPLSKRVKTADLLIFTRQLSTIVGAGLPLMQGLDILAEQTDNQNFAAVIDKVAEEVESGATFSDALRKFPKAFPDLYVSMVRSGEAGGDLDGVLLQLADYLEASEDLKRRIKSAMTYPVVAFAMIILIAVGLIVFVVPQFEQMFAQLGDNMPAPTLLLIAISDALGNWIAWVIIIGACVGLYFALSIWQKTESGRLAIDGLKLRLPVFGMLQRKVAISRFTRTLSTLTRSGVAILQALEIVERTAGNEVFAKAVREAADSVRNGDTLADPLAESGAFPAMVTRMIGVGEKTGALEIMLMKISDFYDSEVKAMVDQLTSLIEPILIGMMGVVVGGIVIALFMPILKMIEAVQ